MATMRAVVVKEAGGDFELEQREIPEPGFGEALVRVHACGICHSDSFAKEGGYPGVSPLLCAGITTLEKAAEAYDKMMSGDARFRMVLTTAG